MIWCLHGFLGLPSDWDFLPFAHRAPNLFAGETADVQPEDALIGYSMGGRLALYQMLRTPTARAVIVSAGITAFGEERLAADERWAQRFESEPWGSLMKAWDAQAVFGGHEVERREENYRREELARALRDWSPAALEPIAPRLQEIKTPILWVVGANDAKYVAEGERGVSMLPNAELWICPGAGHRVPWEQPERFVDRLRAFLELQ